MLLVHFLCVEPNRTIPDQSSYINSVCNQLCNNGFVSRFVLDAPSSHNTSDAGSSMQIKSYAVNEVEEGSFLFRYEYVSSHTVLSDSTAKSSNVFQLKFIFGTYNSGLQMSVHISSDSYIPSVSNKYLESLKFDIKNQVKNDWKKIEWLMDKDSECLSVSLYPELFITENLARQMISETMTKMYGASWWDQFVTKDINLKYKARLSGYKATVPGFANIDDHLLSIDIGDLLTIFQRKIVKWNPSYDKTINEMINNQADWNCEKVKGILQNQIDTEEALWDTVFSRYLSESFLQNITEFEKNRNHIAHNKLLDRQAYNAIHRNIVDVKRDLESGVAKVLQQVVSEEERQRIDEQEEMERASFEKIKESEAGVEIRHYDEIKKLLEESVDQVLYNISEALRFREDIEIEQNGTGIRINYKIDDGTTDIICSTNIDDGEGGSSTVDLSIEGNEHFHEVLRYVNGAVEYNAEQTSYYPTVEDEKPDVDGISERMSEFINELCPNLRQKVDEEYYRIIKEGSSSPVCEDYACDECGEFYIAMDDTYAKKGTCLNCGAKHELNVCIRCNNHFTRPLRRDEPELCDDCLEDFDEH